MDDVWLPPDIDPDEWHRDNGGSVDGILSRLADAQHANVHVAQLARLGVKAHHLRDRRRSGHLHRVESGLYLVGRLTQTPEGRRVGEVLRGGIGALLAGRSTLVACALLREDTARPVDIVVPTDRYVGRRGVRRATVGGSDQTVVDGVPSMTIPRALLHLAATGDERDLRRAWREAAYRRQLHMPAILRVLNDHAGDRGTAILRDLHAERSRLIGATANEFEDRMRSILLEAGMPEPRCNEPLWIDGVRLRPDLYVVERALVIETDGRDGHDDPERRREDALRDELYRSIGLSVVRYGWWAVTYERPRVLADMAAYEVRWQVSARSPTSTVAEPAFTFGVRR